MNLGVISPSPNDASSFYRAFGAWAYLAREGWLNIVSKEYWNWEDIIQCDALFMQRPYMVPHLNVCKMAKQLRVPVWVDWDDNFLNIPPANPAHDTYSKPEVFECIKQMYDLAQVVTVSTGALVNVFPKAKVIPNALNDYVFNINGGYPVPRQQRVTWRGGNTHWEDVEPFLPAIKKVSAANPDWEWHFLGYPHWRAEESVPGGKYTRHNFEAGLLDYLKKFSGLAASVHIVPLKNNPFSWCKSNIAWIEATAAGPTSGSLVVAPDWPEWSHPGVLNYHDEQEFETVLQGALTMSANKRQKLVEDSRKYIQENLLLSEVNKKRLDIWREITRK